ncbi:MAG: hypothetical protein GX337_03115 [Christensenellaceae bacterium]|nr:hypothetical protein [Christensenellaceae bacterium]
MFNIGAGELLLIFLVAFFVVGPEDLPKVARGIKRFIVKAQKFIRQVKSESGWDDVVKEVNEVKDDIKSVADDIDITKDIKAAKKSIEKEFDDINIKKDFDDIKESINEAQKETEAFAKDIKTELEPEEINAEDKTASSKGE